MPGKRVSMLPPGVATLAAGMEGSTDQVKDDRVRDRPTSMGLSTREAKSRRLLLDAAAEVFAKRSVSDVTVEDVLRSSGLARATFYRFFADKEDLLAALYRDAVSRLHDRRVEATRNATTGIECILAGFDVFTRLHKHAAPLIRVLASEALRPGSRLGPIRDELIERSTRFYVSRYEEIEGRKVDAGTIQALILLSDAMHLHMLRTSASIERDIEVVRATLRELVPRVLE